MRRSCSVSGRSKRMPGSAGRGAARATGQPAGHERVEVPERGLAQDPDVVAGGGGRQVVPDGGPLPAHEGPGVEHAAQHGREVGSVAGPPVGVGDDVPGLVPGEGGLAAVQAQRARRPRGPDDRRALGAAPSGGAFQADVVLVDLGGRVVQEAGVVEARDPAEVDLQVDRVEQRLRVSGPAPGDHVASDHVGDPEGEHGGGQRACPVPEPPRLLRGQPGAGQFPRARGADRPPLGGRFDPLLPEVAGLGPGPAGQHGQPDLPGGRGRLVEQVEQ